MRNNFRDWPAKQVVEATESDTNTYIGYSPIAGALLAQPVWVVERVAESGANAFASVCLAGGEAEPEPCAAMTDPAALEYLARAPAGSS